MFRKKIHTQCSAKLKVSLVGGGVIPETKRTDQENPLSMIRKVYIFLGPTLLISFHVSFSLLIN